MAADEMITEATARAASVARCIFVLEADYENVHPPKSSGACRPQAGFSFEAVERSLLAGECPSRSLRAELGKNCSERPALPLGLERRRQQCVLNGRMYTLDKAASSDCSAGLYCPDWCSQLPRR